MNDALLKCERCGSEELKIVLHHEEAQTIVCAKCGDVVAYANGLTRVSMKPTHSPKNQ